MAGVTVSLNGVSKLDARLERIKDINPALITAINKCTGLVSGRAKYRCPVDTGNLRTHIHIHPADTKDGNTVTGIVYNAEFYASYVEFGTGQRGGYPYHTEVNLSYDQERKGQIAQPFLMPALLESKTQINNIVSDAVITAVRKGN